MNERFGMLRLDAKLVPRLHIYHQIENRVDISQELIDSVISNKNFMTPQHKIFFEQVFHIYMFY